MNKSELIEAVAASADLPKAAAARVIDAMIDTITDSLQKSEPVVLVGFGTFGTKDRAARTGRTARNQPAPTAGFVLSFWLISIACTQ